MKETKLFDFAIIGGGLAGLTLAIQLKQAGLSVILFEKEQYPFHKVCGEYISMESWNFLERIGIPLAQFNLPKVNTLRISAPNGNTITHPLPLGGFGISRFTLDNELYKLALQLGVSIETGCTVFDTIKQLIKTSHGNFTARHIIGAWGKRSKLDTVLVRHFLQPHNRKLNDYVGVKYHVKADLPEHTIELHNFKNGYCGISKVDQNQYCLCYLVKGSELKKMGGNIKALEEKVLMKNPFLKKYFTHFPSLYEQPLVISQISFEPKTRVEDQIPLAGDAAGLITPLCGNGMSMAMHASYLLANQLIQYSNGVQSYEHALKAYEQEWIQLFERRLKVGRLIQSLFGNPKLTQIVLALLKPFPSVINALIKQTHGKPF
ncbi:MAG: NAD(P)/FAD-dependent oxidoreductase [Bacteroidia bacterium]|jgi:flavin-dependent dehydrogenase|nr:NAD(P)/FAD-dependent oxidoreductase [Bacteroidia bacterium]